MASSALPGFFLGLLGAEEGMMPRSRAAPSVMFAFWSKSAKVWSLLGVALTGVMTLGEFGSYRNMLGS